MEANASGAAIAYAAPGARCGGAGGGRTLARVDDDALRRELGLSEGTDHPGVEALRHAHRLLAEGKPGLAMHALETELAEPDEPQPMEIGAAAFALRGRAHEAQGRLYHARIDYDLALRMNPRHAFAAEAMRRIDRSG